VAFVISTAASASETITYTYDARGRLVQAAHSGTVNNGKSASYGYDKANNRTSKTVT
jgi:YD repeat-containing protein